MPITDSVESGKSGTIAPEEFETLTEYVEQYNARLLAQKVAKICNKISAPYVHEFPTSSVGMAWRNTASRISSVVGTSTSPISGGVYSFINGLVRTYGPEVVIQKLAKIAKRTGDDSNAATLKTVFPKVA